MIRILIIGLVVMLSLSAAANETNTKFGDRSWQFDHPYNKIIKQDKLRTICQSDPDKCPKDYTNSNSANGQGGAMGNGLGLANGQAIGNNITVVVQGDGNSVVISGDQTNSGNQDVTNTVTDNTLDITSNTQILNGNIQGGITNNIDNSTVKEPVESDPKP